MIFQYDRQIGLIQTFLCALLVALRAHAEQPPEEVVADLELGENVGKAADRAEHLADHAVRAAERRVDLGTDADEAAGDGANQIILLGLQRHDAGLDGLAGEPAVLRG